MTASKGIRARRSDAGQVRLSERDAAVLRFLGDQFGAPLSVVADLYGWGIGWPAGMWPGWSGPASPDA